MATYINTGEEIFQLDATTDIKYSSSASVTSNPIEGGVKDVTDNVNQSQDTVSFSGILTRHKAKGRETQDVMAPDAYIRGLQSIKNNAIIVSITFFQTESLFGNQSNPIQSLEHCIIETFDISKQAGGHGELTVNISAKQVTFADQTEVRTRPITAADMIDDAAAKAEAAAAAAVLEKKTLLDIVAENLTAAGGG